LTKSNLGGFEMKKFYLPILAVLMVAAVIAWGAGETIPVYLKVDTTTAGDVNGTTVSAMQYASGVYKTVITCDNTPVTIDYLSADTNNSGGVKIYDFPEGRILVLGVTVDSMIASAASTNGGFADTDGGDFSVGTALVDGGTLSSTEVDLCPSTSIDPISSTNSSALAASAQFDGTTTAKDIYVNFLIDSNDLTSAASMTFDATVTVTWMNLGDY